MTKVTIERELLERALAASQAYVDLVHKQHQGLAMDEPTYQTFSTARDNTIPYLRAALQAAPAQPVNQVLVEAVKPAIETLERDGDEWGIGGHLRAALAQAQAQPVETHGQDTKPVVSQNDAEVRGKPAQGLTPEMIVYWAMKAAARSQPASEQAAVSGWMPIESAPKDGTTIDLWHEEFGREADCYWGLPNHSCGEAGRLCDDEFHDLEPQWINTFNAPAFPEAEYSHWRLPPPPPLAAAPEVKP